MPRRLILAPPVAHSCGRSRPITARRTGKSGPSNAVGGTRSNPCAEKLKRAGTFRSRPVSVPATGGWMLAATLGSSALEGQRSRFAISFDLEMRWSLHLSLKLMASPRELYDAMQPTFSQTTSKPPFDIRLME
jgi:hypothetical protein